AYSSYIIANNSILRSLSSSSVHKNVFPAHFDTIGIHANCRIPSDFPARHVILPAMPRAGYHFPLQHTLPEGAPAVQARIIDGVKLPTHVCQRYGLPIHLELADRSGRDFSHFCRAHKSHSFSPGGFHLLTRSFASGPL